jgi:phosphoglycerate dehydrogenase-like enzyme
MRQRHRQSHVAGSTIEARENMGQIAAEQVLGILDGKKPPRLINPEVWMLALVNKTRNMVECSSLDPGCS